jgi:hypothetical protein
MKSLKFILIFVVSINALAVHAQFRTQGKAILDTQRVSLQQWQINRKVCDKLYFEDYIQPYLGQTCALAACHGGERAGQNRLQRPNLENKFTREQTKHNYEIILWFVVAKQPTKSRFLLKPLEGVMPHSGGDKLQKNSMMYKHFVNFINGVRVGNVAPVAEAGEDQRIQVGTECHLDGTQSYDRNEEDEGKIKYRWRFLMKPQGSAAELVDGNTPMPTFVPDREGKYLLELVCVDSKLPSKPDTMVVTAFGLLGNMLLIEGESGKFTGSMKKVRDVGASGLHYASVPATPLTRQQEVLGTATYRINVPADGNYGLWTRVQVKSDDPAARRALSLSVDGGPEWLWMPEKSDRDWVFDRLSQERLPVSGTWKADRGVYDGVAAESNQNALMRFGQPLTDGVVSAAIRTRRLVRTGGYLPDVAPRNSLILFDYRDPNNFKFAGVYDDPAEFKAITDWQVLAPFDNRNHTGFTRAYPPESEMKLDATYAGAGGLPVKWQKAEVEDGYFVKMPPADAAVGYAVAFVDCDQPRTAVEFRLGHLGGVRMWVNGQLVTSVHAHAPLVRDQRRFAANLQRGRNTILIKVDQDFGPWGFGLTMADEGNNAFVIGQSRDGHGAILAKQPTLIQVEQPYPARLELKGGVARLFISRGGAAQAAPTVEHNFGAPFNGFVGLGCFGGEAAFDDFEIRGADNKVLFADNFEDARGKIVTLNLTKGEHTLRVTTLDPDVRIDQFFLAAADAEKKLDLPNRKYVKRLFLDLFQRSPSEAELLFAASVDRKQLVELMFASYEYHERWYNDQLYYLFLLRQFDPRAPWLLEIPAMLHQGQMSQRDALLALACSQYFHLRNLGPDNYVNVAIEQLLGRLPSQEELDAGKRMYDGNPEKLLGVAGTSQFHVARILTEQDESYEHILNRSWKRYFVEPAPTEEMAKWVERAKADSHTILAIQKEWILSDRYQKTVDKLRPKSDIQFIRTLYMDLLNREPTQDEFDYVQNALQAIADPIPLRSVIVRIFLDSGKITLPDKSRLTDPKAWVADQYIRFLSREPTPEELRACLETLNQTNTRTVVQAVLSSQEYQYY